MGPDFPVAKAVTGHYVGISIRPGQHEDSRQRVGTQIIANILDDLPATPMTALIVMIVDEGDGHQATLQPPALAEGHRAVQWAERSAQKFFSQFSAVVEF